MDIYRKELNSIYASQHLESERLPAGDLEEAKAEAAILASVGRGAVVVTDASCDRCFIFGGDLGPLMGFFTARDESREESSSDEDSIYIRMHPEDLVDKRLLEYEFFSYVDNMEEERKLRCKAMCRIRMRDGEGNYRYIDNSTQLIRLSPAGKIWLVLCRYDLSSDALTGEGVSPAIVDTGSGEAIRLDLGNARRQVLSGREREILALIQEGLPSKLIADRLRISIHTVNRHRQNIISKLSVSNSIEAIAAAKAMRLL